MAANEPPNQNTSPGETNTSTRAPTQLAVLLAGAGTPPLEAEQARLAPIRLWDAFVLAPERSRLFSGSPRALFGDRPEIVDLRHDALARVVRQVAAALRQRLEVFDNARPNSELLRGLTALTAPRIEGALASFDLQRGTSRSYTAEFMLGAATPDVDPLDAPEAGVLRRFLALAARGLMVEKPGARGAGVVNDLGAVTLALSLMDVCANPRSALRAVRYRLNKAQKLRDDEIMRVRDVGDALRELFGHVVSSATTAGAQGRDLVKETTLTPELMDHLAVALARAVYDGLAPDDEHPLMVPGTGESDVFTVAPMLVPPDAEHEPGGPTLGRYNRIAFVAMPYAGSQEARPSGLPEVRRAPRASVFDEAAFAGAREATRVGASAARVLAGTGATLDAVVDASDPRFVWQRNAIGDLPTRIRRAVELAPSSTHVLVLIGPRSGASREFLDGLGQSLAEGLEWHILSPRASDHSLVIEPLEDTATAGLHLRRADVSRWLDETVLRTMHWDTTPGANVVVNAAATGDARRDEIDVLCSMARDIADRNDPRSVLLVVGAATIRGAANVLDVLAHHPDLETGDVPLRTGSVWLVRTDAPLVASYIAGRSVDESLLVPIAETFSPSPPLAEQAARAALLPPEAKFRGRLLRIAALPSVPVTFTSLQPVLERAASDPWLGNHLRRTLQQGIASGPTARAALASGLGTELLACMRHEVALLVAEWEGARERPHAVRLADVARGILIEQMLTAHPRASLLVSESLAASLSGAPVDFFERANIAEQLHAVSVGMRPTGTVHAIDDSRQTAPLGFALRGGSADIYALIDVTVGPVPARATPVPHLELAWRIPQGAGQLSLIAAVIASVHDIARRWNRDSLARHAAREGRATFAVGVDISIDNKLNAEAVRLVVPLRPGAADADTQRLGVDLLARLLEVSGSASADWSAHASLDAKGPTTVALVGPMLLRDFVQRWTRSLRMLPRHFPHGTKADARYSRGPLIALGTEMGIVTALLQERGIGPTSTNGRAVLARLAASASEVLSRAKDVGALLPIKTSSLEGPDLEVVERVLAISWFLHVNFCSAAPGKLQWAPADAEQLRALVEHHMDRTAIKVWLQRKTSRPDAVESRVHEFIDQLEPTIVVEKH